MTGGSLSVDAPGTGDYAYQRGNITVIFATQLQVGEAVFP